MTWDPMIATLILPVLGALIVGCAGRQLGNRGSAIVASSAVGLSFLAVLYNLSKVWRGLPINESVRMWDWVSPSSLGQERISFGLYVDSLSLTLMSVITGVGFLIHWYSSEYMEHDEDVPRYFTLLNVFVAAMSFLVLADNYATLIIGWGGVGFASFGLIGFWRHKPSAAAASKKAFVMNVIGDIGLMVSVFIFYTKLGTVDYVQLFRHNLPNLPPGHNLDGWLLLATLGLLLAAYAKSAQLPMHTWLPDAMEGPTPVSALIHAATMVTAGVYLLVRSAAFLQLQPGVAHWVAYLGVLTALFAACCAMVQTDLKRVLAYSTMSQLGYMFLAVGVGAYGAAIFHLVTHAFFKALLFLTAGIVIHAAHGEQDMRKLGGLARQMPGAALFFAIGGACLAGVPATSGFFSKESILHAAHEQAGGTPLFVIGALVAVMTAFYTGRAFFMTFLGPSQVEHPHLPGGPTTLSCALLAVLSLAAGWPYQQFGAFLGAQQGKAEFVIEPGATSGTALGLSAMVLVALGVAYALFGKGGKDPLGEDTWALSTVRQGMGIDALYGLLARGVALTGQIGARIGDQLFREIVPGLVGRSFWTLSTALRELQTGQTRYYLAVLTGFVAVLLFFTLALYGGQPQ